MLTARGGAAGGASVECHLSVYICQSATSTECSFLAMEHELICAAQNPSLTSVQHTCLAETTLPPIPPSPPNPYVLAKSFARCGVNRCMPMQAASDAVLKPLLRKYRALLPRAQWRAVCMQVINSIQTVVDSLQAGPEPATAADQSVGSTVHAECAASEGPDSVMHAQATVEEMRWEDLNAYVIANGQLLQCTIFDALQDSSIVV